MEYTLGLYEKAMPGNLSIREKLLACGRAGFDYMEMSVDETEEKQARLKWSRDERWEVVRAMRETGVRVTSMCLSAHRKYPFGVESIAARKRCLEIMEDAVGLAEDLGIRVIQLAGYDEYYGESNEITRGNFYTTLSQCVAMASKAGVILALETMETAFLDTVQKAMACVDKINSPYLKIYPDVGNVANAAAQYGVPAREDLLLGRGQIVAMHLKETKPGLYRDMHYGDGHVDFDMVAETARELGVNRFVGEFWYLGEDDWQHTLREANAFLRGKLEGRFEKNQE